MKQSGQGHAWSLILAILPAAGLVVMLQAVAAPSEQELSLSALDPQPRVFTPGVQGQSWTWWLPAGFGRLVLPVSGGVLVESSDAELLAWARRGSPWTLNQFPVVGASYGGQMAVVIVPWPHYAELVVDERPGIRFVFPPGREGATPSEIVAALVEDDLLAPARVFRQWRCTPADAGGIPAPLPLSRKALERPAIQRLFGAAHFYLWGPMLFSRHDVRRDRWAPWAQALAGAAEGSAAARLWQALGTDARAAFEELSAGRGEMAWLTARAASGVDRALRDPRWLGQPAGTPAAGVIRRNREMLAELFGSFLEPAATWGDGPSKTLIDALRASGIRRGVLLLSDLHAASPRPELAEYSAAAGYLMGPYDSYHSVHDPDAPPDETWETAQFDQVAYEEGRILDERGRGRPGFRGRGFHFSPIAAWPWFRDRVGGLAMQVPFNTWFVDCDATGELFDDYHPGHPATRMDDLAARRHRLEWLARERGLVVGSEEASVLVSDVLDFGQGVQTPYLGHLDPQLRDPDSPYFLGRYWPPGSPGRFFAEVPVAPSLRRPYFDPRVRVPLLRAAFGDEVVMSHHWEGDNFKFRDVVEIRELMEILHMTAPLYHLNRDSWPRRRQRILNHLAVWSPLHEKLATAPLTRFEWLTSDGLVQRTTFESADGWFRITVNFDTLEREGIPPRSVRVAAETETGW
ncbi:MAG: hypothetical protein Kow001_05680 [Acidobacteriota bacterium]